MAGHTKGPRGKRPPPTTSYVSTICMVVFVAFCLLGVWMLTSSSIVPSQATTTTTSSSSSSRLARAGSKPNARSSLRHPSPAGFDEDLATDGAKSEQVAEEDEKPQPRRRESKNEQQQEEEEEEVIRRNDETRHRESQESHGGDGRGDEHVLDGGVDEETRKHSEQQQQQQRDGQSVDEHENSQEEQAAGENTDQMIQHQHQEGVSQAQAEHDGDTEVHVQSENDGDAENQQHEEENGGSNSSNEEDQQQNKEDQQQNEEDQQQNEEESQQQNEEKLEDPNAGESLTDGEPQEVLNESDGSQRSWATQADQSDTEKERRRDEERFQSNEGGEDIQNLLQYNWELCNVTAGADYIPCLDNTKAIKKLHSFKHYEHRERHCPEESPMCLVPLPMGYRRPIEWPKSRDRIWYNNIPHTKLVEVKGHQNWVKVEGDYLVFPGGGTQFIHGALHYIDFIQQSVHDIAWGRRTRIILDVGCGVASFGGYLFERDVLAMSFAPKDEHEAQVQFALERGIPAISAVMGSQRLPFPGRVFDLVHCARCRVPWHADGGTLLLELNRVLRPGGYFVWSATPVYQKLKEDVEIWKAMKSLTTSMCWDLITIRKDKLNGVAAAIYRKPTSNECYENRKHHSPPMCNEDDDPNAAWYIPLKACMHSVPEDPSERGSQWPERWPRRVAVTPYWLNNSQVGVYGKPTPDDFRSDYEHWKRVMAKSYLSGLGINWSRVRNVMDMRAVYGGFAAALKDMKVWVMNVVNIDAPDTLPIIYERGLMGIYHDWCQSFSTYPRTYDLLHADHLFSQLKNRCNIVPVIVEMDRILRPGGKMIVRDETAVVSEVENLLKSLQWEIRLTFSKDQEAILCAEKTEWRPEKYADSS